MFWGASADHPKSQFEAVEHSGPQLIGQLIAVIHIYVVHAVNRSPWCLLGNPLEIMKFRGPKGYP